MIQEWIGGVLVALSIVLVFIGLFGVFRYKDLYAKILVASKIEVVAIMTLFLGIIIYQGFSWFSLKVLLIMIFYMFLSPIITSKILLCVHTEEEMAKEGKSE